MKKNFKLTIQATPLQDMYFNASSSVSPTRGGTATSSNWFEFFTYIEAKNTISVNIDNSDLLNQMYQDHSFQPGIYKLYFSSTELNIKNYLLASTEVKSPVDEVTIGKVGRDSFKQLVEVNPAMSLSEFKQSNDYLSRVDGSGISNKILFGWMTGPRENFRGAKLESIGDEQIDSSSREVSLKINIFPAGEYTIIYQPIDINKKYLIGADQIQQLSNFITPFKNDVADLYSFNDLSEINIFDNFIPNSIKIIANGQRPISLSTGSTGPVYMLTDSSKITVTLPNDGNYYILTGYCLLTNLNPVTYDSGITSRSSVNRTLVTFNTDNNDNLQVIDLKTCQIIKVLSGESEDVDIIPENDTINWSPINGIFYYQIARIGTSDKEIVINDYISN